MIAWWTGGAWVLYFADAPTLVKDLATGDAPFIAYASIGILTFTTFALAGFMREQVCIYMCPWPRIQAALTDEYALNVTYGFDRGEPRNSVKKADALRAKGLPAGDCVDCGQCVAVCPTGIDIRDGLQIDCIQCGLCIDACDSVMAKIGRPTRLIAYDSDINLQLRAEGKKPVFKIIRSRTVLYAAIIAIVGAVMLYALITRNDMSLKAIHDRNPIAVQLKDGSIRNGFSVNVLNKSNLAREYALTVEGVPDAKIEIVGGAVSANGAHVIEVGPDQTREVRVLVSSNVSMPHNGSMPMAFRITDVKTKQSVSTPDHFRAP
jgi:cytochrome c oxidase accessory protein FixG